MDTEQLPPMSQETMSRLPLIERAREDGVNFLLSGHTAEPGLYQIAPSAPKPRIPDHELRPGEQYRFHFAMSECIGCKCCVVACNEQNGNPSNINWRRVGEVEGGWFPHTQRFYLSMGCNHCLEPSCLIGCPVEAYHKDPVTGIVQHDPEACIGCQYCTWNCSYGVPQYNPERGVVGKCDMCYGRLSQGREPACVNACPQGAIRIEIVNIQEWLRSYREQANAPGLPSADDSISTTRVTLPDNLPRDMEKADFGRVRPEQPHWPLVLMTVLTQLSVGALGTIWLLELLGGSARLGAAALAALGVGGLALGSSTLHLGRPAHAYRALKMWKRSWLSREVLLFGCFSFAASLYAASLWLGSGFSSVMGAASVLIGAGGITASARIYLVRARPAWNSYHTMAEFFLTGAILGPLFAALVASRADQLLIAFTVSASAAQLLNQALKFLRLIRADCFELQSSARLLATVLAGRFLLRGALLIGGGIALPLLSSHLTALALALVFALAGEIVGRYLFYVSVVPKNIAAPYLEANQEGR